MNINDKISLVYKTLAIFLMFIGIAFFIGGFILDDIENFKTSNYYLLFGITTYLIPYISGIEN